MKTQPLIPPTLSRVNLADYDPDYTGDYDKKRARDEVDGLQERMHVLQEMLYAQGKYALLIVLQAMDAGGKDSTIKKVFEGINPQGVYVANFKAPTEEELAHDFLWRIHQRAPRKGFIGIFNRSHYEDVLVTRVNKLITPEECERRYDQINAFERLLSDTGTRILKFYLHISKEEQKQRFEDRLKKPDKHWKFAKGDLPVRKKWDKYMEVYGEALSRCNTDYAPWFIVPANKKWYRDVMITRAIVETMESMGLAYPEPEDGLDKVKIPD
jgi:PPK2 family polyphosphate:nucleotide phosphotransferase